MVSGWAVEQGGTTEEWLKRHAPIESGVSLADGTEIGRWRVVAFVARGGSGEVYRAVEKDGERAAALKILHRTNPAARERFAREVRALSELRDKAFPALLETGELGGRPWYATEFLQPLELPITDRAVARLVLAVCRGAGALHALGYVHRDIKPANILSRNGEPVLIDLGLLKKTDASALCAGGTVSVVDGRPVGVGTPGYAAPEQFMGGEISPAADIHAIGVLASTCFCGRPPRAWRGIIRRATSSLPAERYPDVASLARAVRCRHLPAAFAVAGIAAMAIALVATWRHDVRPPVPVPANPVAVEPAAVSEDPGSEPESKPTSEVKPEYETEPARELAEEPVVEPAPTPVAEETPQEPAEEPVAESPPPVVEEVSQEPTEEPVAEQAPVSAPTREDRPIVMETVGSLVTGARTVFGGSRDDEPIVASERLRQKLADQGRNLPNVTPRQTRDALSALEDGMVAIPGRDFEMCKFEMTQAIWETIAGFNPSKEKKRDLPVSNVTMSDVEEFLENLNSLPEVRASGRKYRLPTADEWEYACLAGGTNGFCRLADGTQITEKTLGEVAWFGGNSRNRPHPVCGKKPNAFELYDMHGNVAEFTSTRIGMFDCIWKGNAYNGDDASKFRADLSPSMTYGLSYHIGGFRLARQMW